MDGHGTPYIGLVAMSPKIEQFKDMAARLVQDLFDQSHPIGRLSLVQCAMLGGGTVVTISLAGSLFFSISPNAADHKILLYLLFTLAPFAIVSPLLGPLIDRSRGARRLMVVSSAVGQVVLCPLMATHLHSLLLFPLAFLVLVCQKLYLVTKGALVPRWPRSTVRTPRPNRPATRRSTRRLTLLGTLAGFVASIPGRDPLQGRRLSGGARVRHARVRRRRGGRRPAAGADEPPGGGDVDRPVDEGARVRPGRARRLDARAGPVAIAALRQSRGDARAERHVHVRGLTGFMTFMLAFGLRRMHGVGLYWYGLVLAGSGAGAIVGLVLVGRLRKRMTEQQLLLSSLWLIAITAGGCAVWGTLWRRWSSPSWSACAVRWPSRPSTP